MPVNNYEVAPGVQDPKFQAILAQIMQEEMLRQRNAAGAQSIAQPPVAHMVVQHQFAPPQDPATMQLQQGTLPPEGPSVPPIMPDVSAPQPQQMNPQMPAMSGPVPQPQAGPVPQMPLPQPPGAPQPQAVNPQMPQLSAGAPPMAPTAVPGMQPPGVPPAPPAAGVGNAMGNSLPPELAPGPPTSPAEAAQRRAGWTSLVDQLKTNPKLQMALMRVGTQLIQPVQPGQTPLGHFGQAVAGSMDYLSAMQKAEGDAAHQQAQTEELKAKALTEGQRPAAVAAGAELTQAQTAQTKEQTAESNALRNSKVKEASEKIKLMVAQGNLAQAQATEMSYDLKKNPDYAAAVIEELKARAWHLKNPGADHKVAGQARQDFIQTMAQTLLVADPELATLNKTDPKLALERAKVKASDRWFAAGTQLADTKETAQSMLDYLQAQYDQAAAINDPSVLDPKTKKPVPFDTYLLRKSEDFMSDPKQKALMIQIMRARQGGKGPASGSTKEDDPLGLRK